MGQVKSRQDAHRMASRCSGQAGATSSCLGGVGVWNDLGRACWSGIAGEMAG
jgi:hypothetical protein